MNQDRLLAHFLITEIHARLMLEQGDLNQEYLSEAWNALLQEGKKAEDEVRATGQYFRADGSIFKDYKLLRDSAIPEGPGQMRKITHQFSKGMSQEEILSKANEVVAEWRSPKKIEHEI